MSARPERAPTMAHLPVTILAGSDRRPSQLPESGAGLHPLATYKGAALRVAGRRIIDLLVERLAAAGFGPIEIAGPARVYEPLPAGARILDTDERVALNLRRAIERHSAERGGPLAVLACDVLPSVEELVELRAQHAAAGPCAVWFPLVRVRDPSELGAFRWKPAYKVVPAPGAAPVTVLPGHLGILEPDRLRLKLLYRLMDVAYVTRNHSIAYRRTRMLAALSRALLAADLGRLASLRPPTLTWTVVHSGLRLAAGLRAGDLPIGQVEALVGKVVLRSSAVRELGPRAVRYPIVEMLSLAEDIDTEEEALELARTATPRARPS